MEIRTVFETSEALIRRDVVRAVRGQDLFSQPLRHLRADRHEVRDERQQAGGLAEPHEFGVSMLCVLDKQIVTYSIARRQEDTQEFVSNEAHVYNNIPPVNIALESSYGHARKRRTFRAVSEVFKERLIGQGRLDACYPGFRFLLKRAFDNGIQPFLRDHRCLLHFVFSYLG